VRVEVEIKGRGVQLRLGWDWGEVGFRADVNSGMTRRSGGVREGVVGGEVGFRGGSEVGVIALPRVLERGVCGVKIWTRVNYVKRWDPMNR
jgi:hypothetical protein